MSVPQLISPLLDGFIMGDPISDHHGVRCCPAMHLETEKKYIVKVISVPASNTKLAALLLAGAFPDRAAALAYFEGLAGDLVEEASLLQKLSRYEGFVSYEDWQLVPMEDGDGFDVYLLGAYRPTLEGLLRRNDMTHLSAVNLGLDLCAALSVCRGMGHIYADLRPSNIYICNDREYRIGDLGFMSMSSLEYASLPEKYLSSYTPPEICDAYSALNSTMDTYALGLMLYQAFNGGELPFEDRAPAEALIPPRYADYALSEIILKACAPDPQDRWEDPNQMGQALIQYLQTNTVNDTPIVPLAPQEEAPEAEEIEDNEPSTADILAEVDEALEAAPEIIVAEAEEPSEEDAPVEEAAPVEEEASEEAPEEAEEEVLEAEEAPAEEPEEPSTEEIEEAPAEEAEEAPVEEIEEPAEEEAEEISSVEIEEASTQEAEEPSSGEEAPAGEEIPAEEDAPVEEGAPVEEDAPVEEEEVSEIDETAEMLAQADELIAYQLPDATISTEPTEEAPEEAPAEEAEEAAEEIPSEEAEILEEEVPRKKTHKHNLLTGLIIGILIGLLVIGGFLFYRNFFLQTVYDMTLGGTEDKLTVTLNSKIDDSLLTVLCTDIHGNTIRETVTQGVATFENLKPNTQYKIQVRISGFHKLQGKTTETYTTASQTIIGSFYAATGHEDGSVILSFTVQGPDSNHWIVRYSAEGEEEQTSDPFTGHMVTLNDLTIGKLYTFTLEPVNELYLSGTETITHVPSKLILAKDLHVVGLKNEGLTIEWSAPEDVDVAQWTVHCYNDTGYDKTLTVADCKALFDNIDPASAYTIEVTAAGMTLSERTYLSANSITFQQIWVDGASRTEIVVAWDYFGTEPTGGWLLLYSIDGSPEQTVVQCQTNRGVITPLIPGSKYTIVVQPANGSSVFGGTAEYQAPEADAFSGYQVSANSITLSMCVTPNEKNWDRYDVPESSYKTSFAPGVSASFVMHLTKDYNESNDNIVTLYLIRDEVGNLVSNAIESRTWTNMWYNGYGKLTIPFMPETPGKYTVEIFFNGTAVAKQAFEILPA